MEEARARTASDPAGPAILSGEAGSRRQSGQAFRPIQGIGRPAATAEDAVTDLERYKVSLRRYGPVQKGLGGLPWPGQWECGRCGELTPGRLLHQPPDDTIALEHDCPRCGTWREEHTDLLFTAPRASAHPRQPRETYAGGPVRAIPRALPRTVETLCPECACLILGRSYERAGAVWMEKTCPDKSYAASEKGRRAYRTLMAGGMHFMDRYNHDTERVRRCVIQYSTPDGLYPFCTINCGPTYRPYIEALHARPLASGEAGCA